MAHSASQTTVLDSGLCCLPLSPSTDKGEEMKLFELIYVVEIGGGQRGEVRRKVRRRGQEEGEEEGSGGGVRRRDEEEEQEG